MKRVLFIFDRVAHYHVDLFQRLDQRLREEGVELHLASGEVAAGASGRVGVAKTVLANERKYRYSEHNVRGWMLRRIHGIAALVHDVQPDAVVCMGHVGNVSHWWLGLNRRRLGYKLLAWQCGYEYHPRSAKALLLRRFVPMFDHHLAYHSPARDYALAHGARPQQVTVMHNTINEARITTLPRDRARALLLAKHPQIGERRIVLFVGALLREKNVELLFDALQRLPRRDVVLLVVGDGEHRAALQRLAAGRDDVIFTGSIVDGVGPYFDAAEAYLLPGTGGLGLNEAMAHGLPMLSAYADGSADDLVLDGETGWRLRQGTAAEIAERLQQLLDDAEAAARMGRRGRELITTRFSFDSFTERIVAALRSELNVPVPAGTSA